MGHTTELTFRIRPGKDKKNPHFYNFCKRIEESVLNRVDLEDILEESGGFLSRFFHPSIWTKNLPDFTIYGGNSSFTIGVYREVYDHFTKTRHPVDTYVEIYERENNGLWWTDCLRLSEFLHERLGFDVEVIFWEDGGDVAFIKNTDYLSVYKDSREYLTLSLSERVLVNRTKKVCNWLMEVSDPDFHRVYLDNIQEFLLTDEDHDNWLEERELLNRNNKIDKIKQIINH